MKPSSMEEACYDHSSPTQEYTYHEDEVLETLSLSDLLIYDNNGDPQLDFYPVEDQNANLDTDDHEFEFSSELKKTSLSSSVVFCGKIIPYKEPNVSQNTHKQDQSKKQHKKRRNWRLVSFFKKTRNKLDSSEKLDMKYEVPIKRVSVKMHIRDLKKRQTSMSTRSVSCGSGNSGGNGGGIGYWGLARLLGCGGAGGHNHPKAII
ncbi:hypothetical protein OSB04_026461 [Centaurea solstitialis]|uniref:Uncharacterized protein n=1 Tax=Centaurea solstitialis TaxID=347529 RepID=A0AA38SBY0_9ASTR|nr:hypothetical protein OSB04_026461 [Centaurea solstitialis]